MQPEYKDVPEYEVAISRLRPDEIKPAAALYRKQVARMISSGDIEHSVRASRILTLLQRRLLDVSSW